MNGVHDMGGMHGLGAIHPGGGAPGADEPLFHEPWEARALALTLAAGAWGRWNIDMSRHQRELIPGPDYLRMGYYEKWIAGLAELLAAHGLATRAEIASGRAEAGAARLSPPLTADRVAAVLAQGGPSLRAIDAAPRLAVGMRVRARNMHPSGHTRLPRYARGRSGVVSRLHGPHVFPDAHAHGAGEQPQHLYQVRFEAAELWGAAADGRSAVHLDLWESYLEPA